MILTPTQYISLCKDFKYQFSYSKDGWSVLKWGNDGPKIPPLMRCLTVEGWEPVLNSSSPIKYFTTAQDGRDFVESISIRRIK